jgi:hypothetical protein
VQTVTVLFETLAHVSRYLLDSSLTSPEQDGPENEAGEQEMDGGDLLQMTGTYLLHSIPLCNPEVRRRVGNGARVCSGG